MMSYITLVLIMLVVVKLFVPSLGRGKLSNQNKKTKKIVLDSCGIIDGRILDLSRAGFMSSQLIIPDFIVHELQLLADSADTRKRERARYGLNVIKDLQSDCKASIQASNSSNLQANLPTDDKLVVVAKRLGAQLYTTDFNLQKVAEIAGVGVLNVNDLAQKLRPIALPGERKNVKIIQKGNNTKQGVGYLEDGTMIVVENGAQFIGKMVEVEVTRTHQTVSGKMLFGDLIIVKTPSLVARHPIVTKFKTKQLKKTPISDNFK